MAFYRKRPVEIEARRFIPSDEWEDFSDYLSAAFQLAEWCEGMHTYIANDHLDGPGIAIGTLEGTMYAKPGDYIIKGVSGEFYPCDPDIFHQTYDKV